MKHLDDWSIAYVVSVPLHRSYKLNLCSFSGDTLPTSALALAGRNSTLLIHEATMADDQEALALQKAHSTFRQAISVGKTCVSLQAS